MPIIRGDDVFWDIAIPLPGGSDPFPLAGCTVWVTAKPAKQTDIPDADAAWQHSLTLNGSGEVTASHGLTLGEGGAAGGIVVEHLTAAESETIAPGSYRYDVQVKDASGVITTVLAGSETVVGDITRAR